MTIHHPMTQRRITIKFNRRDDGGLRAHSDDIPEFYLASPNPQDVLDDVIPVMEKILQVNYNEELKIVIASDLDVVAKELGLVPQVDQSRQTQRETLGSAQANYIGIKVAA